MLHAGVSLHQIRRKRKDELERQRQDDAVRKAQVRSRGCAPSPSVRTNSRVGPNTSGMLLAMRGQAWRTRILF